MRITLRNLLFYGLSGFLVSALRGSVRCASCGAQFDTKRLTMAQRVLLLACGIGAIAALWALGLFD